MENEEDPVKRQQILDARARNISHNVRCLECGSQSIEESQADIAVLLRKLIRDEIRSGKSDKDIYQKLENEYGETILYLPKFDWQTAGLWLSPIERVEGGSPVIFTVDNPQAQLLDPAVKGTLNVLKSAARVPCLKKVVFTSSTAAVMFGVKPPEAGDVIDETWFSDPVICEQKKNWYALSKTLAEETAVRFSKENGLELVVINPGFVLGPLLQPTLNVTSEGFMSMIKTGKDIFPDGVYRLVDVRDVATAHILAFKNPNANGRYLMVGNSVHSSMIFKIVDKLYPALGHSERYKDGKFVEKLPFGVSRAKAEGLGVEFTPMEASIKDIVESLKEKKLLVI